jgi:phosphate acyltransferase
MSGDLGPRVVISAAKKFTSLNADVNLLLVGDSVQLLSLAPDLAKTHPAIKILPSSDVVTMSDAPLKVLRHKKQSSMWLALSAVRDGSADACVSAGNTGALLAMARHLLGACAGIDRPAICKSMPVSKGRTYLLDLGANIDCTAQQLHQFALMGSVLAGHSTSELPRVALLNIGVEEIKGTSVLKEAALLIGADPQINYVGFIEANKIFTGAVDVIVCDGFHGNIALKASEGVAVFIADKIKAALSASWITKLITLLALPIIRRLQLELDPAHYNGASFLGLTKTLVKSHGNANEKAFLRALIVAREQALQQIPALIQEQLSSKYFR